MGHDGIRYFLDCAHPFAELVQCEVRSGFLDLTATVAGERDVSRGSAFVVQFDVIG